MALPSRAVLVPIRSFANAKSRLSPVLNADQRQRLAQRCAERVLQCCGFERTLVICDDREVADWARALGVRVLTVTAVGLNASLQEAVPMVLADRQPTDVVIVHGDLAFPGALSSIDDLAPIGDDGSHGVFIIPDRHGDGTNVLGVGTALLDRWRFAYGPHSFQAHCDQAQALTASVAIIHHADLGFDIDTPEDLRVGRVRDSVSILLPDWIPHEQ